jgi:aminoglycoside 6'-N-acetyltransferase I
MRIRPVEAHDADAWAAMRGRLWPEADAADLLAETRAFTTTGPTPLVAAAFVAEDGDARPQGFIEVSIRPFADGCDSMPIPFVEGWYVEPAAQGCGIGRALMSAAEAWARDGGYTELGSDTQAGNEVGRDAHLACGFSEVERIITFRKPLV